VNQRQRIPAVVAEVVTWAAVAVVMQVEAVVVAEVTADSRL
jgi:hypothetical protein